MKRMKLTVLLLLVLAPGLVQAQQRHALSARQAIEYARKNSVQIKNALLDIQIQQQTNKEITASALPQINGSAGLNYFPNVAVQVIPNFLGPAVYGVLTNEGVRDGTGQPIKSPDNFGFIQAQFGTKFNNSVGVNLSQILFDGQVFIGLQARNAAMSFARKAAEVTEEGIRANVYKVYYQLAASKSQIGILEANITRIQKLLEDTRKLYENGFAERLDISKLEVQVANLNTEKIKALNNINNGFIGLKLLIGMPITDSLVITDSITYDDIRNGVLDASQYSYADRKEFQYAELGRQLGEFNVRRYELSRLPTVTLNSNYNYIRQANNFGFGGMWFRSSLIGVSVNVPIFGGFARDARADKARLELQQANNNIEGLKLSIDREVNEAINNYRSALATLDVQKRNMELAETVYGQTQLKFQQGIGSNTEISTAQTDLSVAQNNYILATYDAISAKIDFLKATGKLQ
jgi:outer membrane protein TolC